MAIKFSGFDEYFHDFHPHTLYYGYNGSGKTTFAGKTGLRTVLIDCGDAGVMTLRKFAQDPKHSKLVKIIRARGTSHYMEVMEEINRRADAIQLLVVDTLSGLEKTAVKEVKGRGGEMSQRKWGQAAGKVIECISETKMFPNDIIYLAQEKRRMRTDDNGDDKISINPSLMPSVREYLSSSVDWVGRIYVEAAHRKLSFILTEEVEAKDRSDLFPKVLRLPAEGGYMGIRRRIVEAIHD